MLRREIPTWLAILLGLLSVVLVLAVWWFVTTPNADGERLLSYFALPSPAETWAKLRPLWFEDALMRNLLASLRRVLLGFGLAVLVGVPLGVLCGCFPWARAFFQPLSIFGRNIPIAALIPLTFALFGIGELYKVMFIFIATVAFILYDTAAAVADVSQQYVDTAYTLGANTRQVVTKVLVPLALPRVFNSIRLLFGLAFGYIMLAEVVTSGEEKGTGGLGNIINVSMGRGGNREYIILILILIPLVALAIDRVLFWVQKELFPYRYGGTGLLYQALRVVGHGWEDLVNLFRRRPAPAAEEKQAS